LIGFIFSQVPEETEKGNQPKADRSVCGGGVLSLCNISVEETPGPDLSGQCGEGKTPP